MFKPPKIQCNNCKDIIFSKYSGEFVTCKCGVESDNLINETFEKIKNAVRETFLGEWVESNPDRKWFMVNDIGHYVKCELTERLDTGVSIDSTPYYTRILGSQDYTVIDPGEEEKQ